MAKKKIADQEQDGENTHMIDTIPLAYMAKKIARPAPKSAGKTTSPENLAPMESVSLKLKDPFTVPVNRYGQ